MSDSQRIENLEWAVRRLTDEVSSLRASLAGLEGKAPDAAPRAAAEPTRRLASEPSPAGRYQPRPEPRPEARPSAATIGSRLASHIPHPATAADWEALVGRYGAMALAALTILLGVGAFIGWAVNHVQLGPGARVLLGAAATGALAALGFWLRERGARSYGNALLAISLALANVVAWGAGPYLGVIPVGAALGIADLCSVALALLALQEGEELLFVVGLGGSLLAPFVFHEEGGKLLILLAYGLTVQIAGAGVIRDRDWRWAARTLAVGCALYALGAMAWLGDHAHTTRLDATLHAAPGTFVLACIATTLLLARGRRGVGIAATELVTLMLVLLAMLDMGAPALVLPALALAGTLAAYWVTAHAEPGAARRAMATLPPLVFLAMAIVEPATIQGTRGALTALAWTGVALAAAWSDLGDEGELHWLVAGLCGGASVALGFHVRETVRAGALGAYGLGIAAVAAVLRRRTLLVGAVCWLGLGWALALLQLAGRAEYDYAPFLTAESAAMAIVVAGWAVTAWSARRLAGAAAEIEWATTLAVLAGLGALLWGRQELAWAFSREIGVFLVIAYYALVGVGALLAGRWRGSALVRRVGLGLAIYAALKSLVEAAALSAVSLRVGSFLLVGVFLLGVAWLYRTAGDGEREVAREAASGVG